MRIRNIALTVTGFLYFYLSFTLFGPLLSSSWRIVGFLILLGMFGSILWLPLVYWQRDRDETTRFELLLQWMAFCFMGILSFVFVLSLLRDFLSLVGVAHLRGRWGTLTILKGSLLLFSLGFLNARHKIKVKRVEVYLPQLPESLQGLKIVQITDLHVGPTIKKEFVEKVVEKANSCEPDLIVLTGDLVDGSVAELSADVEPLSRLKSKYGTYYVTGNHEYYWDPLPWIEKFKSLGMIPLLNRHLLLPIGEAQLLLAGVPDPAALSLGLEGPDFSCFSEKEFSQASLKILLCHQPKFAKKAEKSGFDLQISGHTHGGQFFPWTLVVRWVHQFPNGLYRLKKMAIYVSSGTGYWGPPVRLGAPSEVTLLVLDGRGRQKWQWQQQRRRKKA